MNNYVNVGTEGHPDHGKQKTLGGYGIKLNNRLREEFRKKIIKDFKEGYPSVYEWFNGDYFYDLIIAGEGEVNLTVCYYKDGEEVVPFGLPFKTGSSIVPLGSILTYLKAEGFCYKVYDRDNYTTLYVVLEG